MNKKQAWAALGAALALGLAAHAPASAQEGSGPYVGASLGQADYRKTCDFYDGTCDSKDTGYRLFGGYYFSPGLAIEAGYANLADLFVDGTLAGTTLATHFEATAKAGDVSLLPIFAVNERLAVFGRFGVYRSQLEVRGLGSAFRGGTRSEHNTGWTYGAGLRFDFGRAFAIRAEWQRYDNVGGSSTGEDDIDFFSGGLILRF
jgi:OmpA-OmpF porin, OOP family